MYTFCVLLLWGLTLSLTTALRIFQNPTKAIKIVMPTVCVAPLLLCTTTDGVRWLWVLLGQRTNFFGQILHGNTFGHILLLLSSSHLSTNFTGDFFKGHNWWGSHGWSWDVTIDCDWDRLQRPSWGHFIIFGWTWPWQRRFRCFLVIQKGISTIYVTTFRPFGDLFFCWWLVITWLCSWRLWSLWFFATSYRNFRLFWGRRSLLLRKWKISDALLCTNYHH